MKRLLLLALIAALAGCDTLPKRVEVPISVPCRVTLPERPAWAIDALAADSGLYDRVRALLAERVQRQGYEAQLEAAAKACQ